MSDSNQEPVCSSDELTEKNSVVENTAENEAEAKPMASPVSSSNDRVPEPDVVSSSNSGVEIRGGVVRSPKPHVEDDEDDDSNDAGTNGDREFNPPPICSPFGSVSSNSKSNPFQVLKAPVLRPSSFKFSQSQSPSSSTPSSSGGGGGGGGFILRPPKLIPNSGSVGTKSNEKEETKELNNVFVPLEMTEGSSPEPGLVPGGAVSSSELQAGSSSAPQNPEKSAEAAAFVFGSNLEERAVADLTRKRKMEQEVESTSSPENKKLNISEREVITGEEDELNVMQLHVKLFIFDSVNSSWVERGRGTLRLNDSKSSEAGEEEQEDVGGGCSSRLIVRSKGSLRVMLNTKVWDGMRVEKVGDKGVRLMAVDLEAPEGDDGKPAVRIFLIMTTSISDANSLVGALESRVNKC